jgi:hypothetical protein
MRVQKSRSRRSFGWRNAIWMPAQQQVDGLGVIARYSEVLHGSSRVNPGESRARGIPAGPGPRQRPGWRLRAIARRACSRFARHGLSWSKKGRHGFSLSPRTLRATRFTLARLEATRAGSRDRASGRLCTTMSTCRCPSGSRISGLCLRASMIVSSADVALRPSTPISAASAADCSAMPG